MKDDTTIIPFHQPGSIIDPLTEIARDGARRMLMAVMKAEADGFFAAFSESLLVDIKARGLAFEVFSALRYVRRRPQETGFLENLDLLADPDDPRDLYGMLLRSA